MSNRPVPQPGIDQIAPYVPGRSRAPEGVTPIKLSANESPLGASPKALEALEAEMAKVEIYPDGGSRHLRDALAEVHELEADRIVCGNGSGDLLHLLAQAYLGEGDEAVMSRHGFSVYPIITQATGARIVLADETDYTADVDAMLAAVTERTRVIFLANPNNPTGTYIPGSELRRLHAGLRPDILLVADGAYAEYVTADDYETGAALVREAENVVMVRTFSKIGLARLRVGWMYGPVAVIDMINRIRGPFNVNGPGQAAAAAAARDTAFTVRLCAHNAKWRDWLTEELGSNRLRVVPSQGNFVLVLFPDEPGQRASDAFQSLFDKGLIVREVGVYGIDNGLRISIGSEQNMRAVAEVLKSYGAGGAAA
jgi:histidinol-phosphate aminotransferase